MRGGPPGSLDVTESTLFKSTALFVLGPPGVGKTTAIRALVDLPSPGCMTETEVMIVPKPKWTIVRDVVLAGHYKGDTFDGGDTVGYADARKTLEYWQAHLLPAARLTIFDGDRFSTRSSLDFVKSTGVRIVGVHLTALPEVIAERCAARGSNQNPTWMKGRITKARNFAEMIGAYTVSANAPIWMVVERIRAVLS